jgi:hypothetical protein
MCPDLCCLLQKVRPSAGVMAMAVTCAGTVGTMNFKRSSMLHLATLRHIMMAIATAAVLIQKMCVETRRAGKKGHLPALDPCCYLPASATSSQLNPFAARTGLLLAACCHPQILQVCSGAVKLTAPPWSHHKPQCYLPRPLYAACTHRAPVRALSCRSSSLDI